LRDSLMRTGATRNVADFVLGQLATTQRENRAA